MECWILRLPAPRQAFKIREKGGSMADKAEQLDFLTRMRIRELVLMGLISVTAVLANLPHEYVEETLGVSHATLIAVLACVVILGLFLYLKFFLFVAVVRSEEHTSELQSLAYLVCRLLLEKKKKK